MSISRRQLLIATPALLPLSALGAQSSVAGDPAVPVSPAFPYHDPGLVKEMVGVSHGKLDKVRELLAQAPELAKAAWDWGFGDWESALGAASHTGNREIAALLIEHGARPDIFTFAMLGNLAVVQAYVQAHPGIQRTHGPHGITLLKHAQGGGPEAASVLEFLTSLGDADQGYAPAPLAEEQHANVLGEYSFGPGTADRLEIKPGRDGTPMIRRLPDGTVRGLIHLGGLAFFPVGAMSVRITLTADGATLRVQGAGYDVTARKA